MFYRPEIMPDPRWNELSSLPYLTLIEYLLGQREIFDQEIVEHMCWTSDEYAGSYDWVLVADPDEYLWLAEYIGENFWDTRHTMKSQVIVLVTDLIFVSP